MFGLDETGKTALRIAMLKTFGAIGGVATAIVAANYAIDHFGTREVIATAGIASLVGMTIYLVKWAYDIERFRIENEQRELMRTLEREKRLDNYREYTDVSGRTKSFLQP